MDPARRFPLRPMMMLSCALHGVLAVLLVWGPSWIPRRHAPITAYEVDLVSFPLDTPRPAIPPAVPRPEPKKTPPPPQPAKPKSVKRPAPSPVEPAPPRKRPAPSPEPEAVAKPAPPVEQPPEPHVPTAKATEPTEPGIQLVTPRMEAVALKYPFYINQLKRKLGDGWSPPGAGFAKRREALVTFTILRDGDIQGADIEQSSGDAFYDQAALRAVLRAKPLPPFPSGYPEDTMKIYLSFSLDPDQKS